MRQKGLFIGAGLEGHGEGEGEPTHAVGTRCEDLQLASGFLFCRYQGAAGDVICWSGFAACLKITLSSGEARRAPSLRDLGSS